MKLFACSLLLWAASWLLPIPTLHSQTLIMGYSGAGITTDLQCVIAKERLWDKYGLSVKSVYFNSGSTTAT